MNDLSKTKQHFIAFVRHYSQILQKIVTDPASFFRDQVGRTDVSEPALFAAINILIPKVFYALLFAPITLGISFLLMTLSVFLNLCIWLGSIVLILLFAWIAGIKKNNITLFRCTAYTSVAYLAWLIPIPFANLVTFTVIYCILLYFVLTEAHDFSQIQSIIFLVILFFLTIIVGVIVSLYSISLVIQFLLFFIKGI